MSAPRIQTSESHAANERAVDDLRHALGVCLDVADETGHSLPEMLREALEELAVLRGSVDALVRHRPARWEAVLVQRLAHDAQEDIDGPPPAMDPLTGIAVMRAQLAERVPDAEPGGGS